VITRRSLFASAAAIAAAGAPPQAFELEEVSIDELGRGLGAGRWTSKRLVELYFERIDAIDRSGPRLRSVIELNPDAEAIAAQLDKERKAGKVRGPLHGIPILLKDNIGTGDRMATSAGSLALEHSRVAQDAFIAERLRDAGALILGKTNLSEWANFRSNHSTSGWSGRGGQTLNPYALRRNPSGSSSGSAAAVAASLCAAAIGTETDGSIVSPSTVNGLVGIKPTVGLLSRTGIVPISHSQDTPGPMTRSVRDAALLLGVLAGIDAADPATAAASQWIVPNYTKYLDAGGLRKARLGIARKYYDKGSTLDRFLSHCVEALKAAGAEIVDGADLDSFGKGGDEEYEVMLYEFKTDLNAYLATSPENVETRTLASLIDFNLRNRDREMPYFDQETFEAAEAKGPLTEEKYTKARATCLKLNRTEGIDGAMAKYRVDAIVTLTGGPAWLTDHINGDYGSGGCSGPAAVAGYPHITVPAGFVRGLPVGLSFFSTAWSEPSLLKFAYAFEQATNARRKPSFAEDVL
jgi:amidase